ncbi:hypothetical protein SRHO_G00025870 [Serrasalmus rhombeus]
MSACTKTMTFEKQMGVDFKPNSIQVYWNMSTCVMKAVKCPLLEGIEALPQLSHDPIMERQQDVAQWLDDWDNRWIKAMLVCKGRGSPAP